jgi:large subunit ribosomal protein L29e
MLFTKKHNKKGLKKMQANNAKAVSARAEAIMALVKPQAVKPKMPKGPSSKLRLSSLTPSLGRGIEATWPRIKGSANQSLRFKPKQGQSSKAQASDPAKAPKRVQKPCEDPIEKGPSSVKTDGLL